MSSERHDFLALSKQLFERLNEMDKNLTNINKKFVGVYKRLKVLEGENK